MGGHMTPRRVGILTGGGDCPGLNAVIRAAGKCLLRSGNYEVIGIRDGFAGLIEKRIRKLNFTDLSGIMQQGGTILGTSNRADPCHFYQASTKSHVDLTDQVLAYAREIALDGLLCIGGDGTQAIAYKFHVRGLPLIGIPKTIDNDLMATDITFGFDTAVAIVAEALDRLHTTARSHHRVMILEVMGRNAGWIALHGGVAGGADVILLPEIPYQTEKIAEVCRLRSRRGEGNTIIVVAEGASNSLGKQVVAKTVEGAPEVTRLGGIGQYLAKELEPLVENEIRVTILGHLQRGGSPTSYDRNLATMFGVEAARCVMENDWGKMVAYQRGQIARVPIETAIGHQKLVQPDNRLLLGARAVGTCFGDG